MKITFLGTNGWFDTRTGNTLCVLIETQKEYIICDAGNGIYKLDRYIKKGKPIYLFISHFHLDHIIGLHILDKFNFTQGIDMIGPRGIKKIISCVINKPYTIPLGKLKTKVRISELGKIHNLPFKIESRKLLHSSTCYGYRFLLEGKIITFCTDTGVCRNLYYLARNADLLITECSYKSNQVLESWPHLNPESASCVARDAGVKKMALIHFDASLYLTLKERKKAESKARLIFDNSFAASDGTRIRF